MSPRIWQSKNRTGVILLLTGTLLVLTSICWAGVGAERVEQRLTSLKGHLDGLEKLTGAERSGRPGSEMMAQARADLIGARDDLAALQTELEPLLPLCSHLGWVPFAGGDVQAAPDLLEAAVGAADGGVLLFDGIYPCLEHYAEGRGNASSSSLMQQGAKVLANAEPNLVAARARFAAAAEARQRIRVENLSPRTAGMVESLDRYLPLIQTLADGALIASRVMEGTKQRTYLILAQNDDELRATGGLISGVILLTVQGGKLIDLSFTDSYAVDNLSRPYPEPPTPWRDYMAADLWLFRDANWSPDFPTAARDTAELYKLGQGKRVDGVIAVDQQAVRLAIEALGPLRIEGYDGPITSENLLEFMRRAWSPGSAEEKTGEWWRHRKDFMPDLLSAVMDRLQKDPESVDLMRLAEALRQSVEERHLIVCLYDPVAARVLAESGWDGALRPGSGDYLMVVDTNMGFNKVDPNVRQGIAYSVDLTDASNPGGEVAITYYNASSVDEKPCVQEARYGLSYEDMMNRCYWDYLRVIVPPGSQLVAATPAPLPEGSLLHTFRGVEGAPDTVAAGPGERGTMTFSAFFVVKRGETRQVRFAYTLPPTVIESEGTGYRYNLLVQKQAGKGTTPLEVRVKLPTGAEVVVSNPQPTTTGKGVLVYKLSLQTDRRLELLYR